MVKYTFLLFIIIAISANAQKVDSSYKLLDSAFVTTRNIKNKNIQLPYFISSIGQQQITQNGARTTPETLMGIGGVFIQKTNHGGGSAFIRGLTGNQTLLIIDGIRLNNATYRYGPNQYLNTIDLFTIDKIDILKGIGAIEYGSDAMGGVINITTKEASSTILNKINLSNTSKFISGDMEKTNRTDISYAEKKWNFIGGVSFKKFGDLVGGADLGKLIPTGYSEKNYDAKLKIKIDAYQELTIASQNTIQHNVPIYHKIVLENFATNQIDYQIHYLNYIKYKVINKQKWISEFILNASTQRSIEQRSNQKNNSLIYRNEADTIKNIGLTAEIISKPTSNWTINTGIDYYRDLVFSEAIETSSTFNSPIQKRGLYPNGSVYKNSSIFNLHFIDLGKLSINTGVRYNFLAIQIKDAILGDIAVKPAAFATNFGINYQLNPNHYLFGSMTRGYRAPNIDDLGSLGIIDFRYEIPNYDLKPEQSNNFEIGYKYNSKKVNFSISAFQMNLKDIIARVLVEGQIINGYKVYNKENIETSYIKGAELTYAIKIDQNFDLQINTTYTYGQNVTKNEPMRRIPPIFGQNRLAWHKKNIFLSITHQFAGKQNRLAQGDIDDNRIGKLGTPHWNLINFDAGIKLKHLHLNTSLINILNEKYKTHGSGVYGMGRAVSVSVQWIL
jgi:outer membrane receptor protein involved in Fe transport